MALVLAYLLIDIEPGGMCLDTVWNEGGKDSANNFIVNFHISGICCVASEDKKQWHKLNGFSFVIPLWCFLTCSTEEILFGKTLFLAELFLYVTSSALQTGIKLDC